MRARRGGTGKHGGRQTGSAVLAQTGPGTVRARCAAPAVCAPLGCRRRTGEELRLPATRPSASSRRRRHPGHATPRHVPQCAEATRRPFCVTLPERARASAPRGAQPGHPGGRHLVRESLGGCRRVAATPSAFPSPAQRPRSPPTSTAPPTALSMMPPGKDRQPGQATQQRTRGKGRTAQRPSSEVSGPGRVRSRFGDGLRSRHCPRLRGTRCARFRPRFGHGRRAKQHPAAPRAKEFPGEAVVRVECGGPGALVRGERRVYLDMKPAETGRVDSRPNGLGVTVSPRSSPDPPPPERGRENLRQAAGHSKHVPCRGTRGRSQA